MSGVLDEVLELVGLVIRDIDRLMGLRVLHDVVAAVRAGWVGHEARRRHHPVAAQAAHAAAVAVALVGMPVRYRGSPAALAHGHVAHRRAVIAVQGITGVGRALVGVGLNHVDGVQLSVIEIVHFVDGRAALG